MNRDKWARVPVLAWLALILSLTTVAAYPNGIPELSGGAASPPVLDGSIGDTEWGGATSYSVTVGNRSVVIYVMNDAQNLYIAVRVSTPNAGYSRDAVRFEFDNDNDGDFYEMNHDAIQLYLDGEFADWSSGHPGNVLRASDQMNGGTTDGGGGARSSQSDNFFELSHPLNSGDALDIALEPGDMVGVKMSISENGEWLGAYGGVGFNIRISVPSYRLTVVVVDLLGSRVQGVTVKIEGSTLLGGSQTATTNSSGQAVFYRLGLGTYLISAGGASGAVQLTANDSFTLNVITSMNWIIIAVGAIVLLAVAAAIILNVARRRPQVSGEIPPVPPPPAQ